VIGLGLDMIGGFWIVQFPHSSNGTLWPATTSHIGYVVGFMVCRASTGAE
jgi:hypothetical protein